VFYEHQLPHPWTTTSEYDLLQQSLGQFHPFARDLRPARCGTKVRLLFHA
jgi:hypothetical protein